MPKREQFFNTLLGESQGHVIVKHNLLFFSASGGIGDGYLFLDYAPGPDLAYEALVGRIQLRNNIVIIRYSRDFAPPDPVPVSGRGGRASYSLD